MYTTSSISKGTAPRRLSEGIMGNYGKPRSEKHNKIKKDTEQKIIILRKFSENLSEISRFL